MVKDEEAETGFEKFVNNYIQQLLKATETHSKQGNFQEFFYFWSFY